MTTNATLEATQAAADRSDHQVPGDPGMTIFVREVMPKTPAGMPVLLVHGGGPGGLPSFDLPVPGYSVAEDIADSGHPVYVMEVRGWGGSTRPTALYAPQHANPPAVSSEEAVRDIDAVVRWIQDRTGGRRVALVGWASGGHWCGMHTARHNESVSHMVMLNSLYGVAAPWGLQAAFEDPEEPGEFNRNAVAYRLLTESGLLGSWDRAIPEADKTASRDPAVAEAFVRAALDSDPASATREPPSMRAPAGFQLDSYLMARGMQFWDAADITVPTLVIRGELDHWSRPDDLRTLRRELVNAPKVTTLTIPGGTHYLFLDRPERGRTTFIREVTTFVDV